MKFRLDISEAAQRCFLDLLVLVTSLFLHPPPLKGRVHIYRDGNGVGEFLELLPGSIFGEQPFRRGSQFCRLDRFLLGSRSCTGWETNRSMLLLVELHTAKNHPLWEF